MDRRRRRSIRRWLSTALLGLSTATGCSSTYPTERARALSPDLPGLTGPKMNDTGFFRRHPRYAYASFAAKGMHPQLGVAYDFWSIYHPAEPLRRPSGSYDVKVSSPKHRHHRGHGRRQIHLKSVGGFVTVWITQPRDPELYYCWSDPLHALTIRVTDSMGKSRKVLLGPGPAAPEGFTRAYRPGGFRPHPLTAEPGPREVLWIQGQERGEPVLKWHGRYVPLEEGVFTVSVSEDFRGTWGQSDDCLSQLRTALEREKFTFRSRSGSAPFDPSVWVLDFEAVRPDMERFILDHRVDPIQIVSNPVKIVVRRKKRREP